MNKSINLVEHFEPYILKCRPGDWNHAKRVVEWIKRLGADHPNYELLVVVGYIHDIGWSELVPLDRKLSREELLRIQPEADKQTVELVKDATKDLDLTADELATVLRLIKATEQYEAVQDDEEIMVDADNLSKTNPDHVKEKYARSDWLNICGLFEEKLPQRIKTKMGRELFETQLAQLRVTLSKELSVIGLG